MEKKLYEILEELNLKVPENKLKEFVKKFDVNSLSKETIKKLIIENLTIGESYFFRDREIFNTLKDILITKKFWRILSIGCSRGEEVYTLSFLINDLNLKAKIVGIDINSKRINQAKEGKYKFWSVRFLESIEIEKYFIQKDNVFFVKEKYKKNVEFYTKSILELSNKFDIIFTRRVLIYIPDKINIVKKLNDLLDNSGYLILGQGEYHPEIFEYFNFDTNPSILQKAKISKSPKTKNQKNKKKFYTKEKNLSLEEEIQIVENYIEHENYKKAYEIIKRLSKKYIFSYIVFKYKALVELMLNKKDDAKKSLKKALLLNKYDEEIWQLRYLIEE
ncbi:chemotaxis protein CheR [Thermosipho melanesiensis]|uniref:MCP methyltransferase, CheR-type n=2 Tax=Thermosipho melanesiensis TaxID=46541 RepID=A6LM54_THEM4|nr:CheR family methyltransferase [Thermosipho melanesiensis]ABR31005.1 MCP methyltransferase, CheR-type [Thermosipho melanesiensis BI429]APT74099.1 chemotaxis protein CheR [Thermosipho melanesiensis]OOC36046.1 chemotaxis protein CheR [Thermosipho melanesiensis]OOC36863.1 chemotaxis protein CheR [Thermosipho melanesiensis]OOC37614.1 chemotaxis protein CheR [Thermosipho melanesiensis]